MAQYYIIELQNRDDGVVNSTITGRSTLPAALSYYYDRKSKEYPRYAAPAAYERRGGGVKWQDVILRRY